MFRGYLLGHFIIICIAASLGIRPINYIADLPIALAFTTLRAHLALTTVIALPDSLSSPGRHRTIRAFAFAAVCFAAFPGSLLAHAIRRSGTGGRHPGVTLRLSFTIAHRSTGTGAFAFARLPIILAFLGLFLPFRKKKKKKKKWRCQSNSNGGVCVL